MAQRLKTDWTLFLTILMMVCFGLVIVYSASSVAAELKYHTTKYSFITRQLCWAVASFLLLMFLKRRDYRTLYSPIVAFTGLGLVMAALVVVYFVDSKTHRWFRMGIGSLQPSEFAKPALVVFLAYFISKRLEAINDRYTLRPALMVVGAVLFVVVGPDFGTAVVLALTSAVMFYVAGIDRRYIAMAVLGGLCCAGVAVLAKPYRLSRVIGFFDPDHKVLKAIDHSGKIDAWMKSGTSTRDTTYQARQSKIAVGAGGVFGAGLMQGKQKLLYLPEAHTDFIYAVVGEELGLWGCTALLAGFLMILWRGWRLFWLAPDPFGQYLALGITACLVLQALMNISVALGLGPTKGIPLPMISFGGSSLLSSLISLGILLSVSEQAG